MSKVQKISVTLTPELNKLVQDAIEAGQYATASEVVREALRSWAHQEKAKSEAITSMRKLIQDGIDSGPGEAWDIEKMKKKLHAEYSARSKF